MAQKKLGRGLGALVPLAPASEDGTARFDEAIRAEPPEASVLALSGRSVEDFFRVAAGVEAVPPRRAAPPRPEAGPAPSTEPAAAPTTEPATALTVAPTVAPTASAPSPAAAAPVARFVPAGGEPVVAPAPAPVAVPQAAPPIAPREAFGPDEAACGDAEPIDDGTSADGTGTDGAATDASRTDAAVEPARAPRADDAGQYLLFDAVEVDVSESVASDDPPVAAEAPPPEARAVEAQELGEAPIAPVVEAAEPVAQAEPSPEPVVARAVVPTGSDPASSAAAVAPAEAAEPPQFIDDFIVDDAVVDEAEAVPPPAVEPVAPRAPEPPPPTLVIEDDVVFLDEQVGGIVLPDVELE